VENDGDEQVGFRLETSWLAALANSAEVTMVALVRTLLILLLLPGCRGPATPTKIDIGKDLTPKGATMVATVRNDDPNVWERSFTVQAVYPTLAIGDEAFYNLRKQGWKLCGSDDKWTGSADRSRGTPATIYQRMQQWRNGKETLKILFRYRVEEGTDPAAMSAQRVTLWFEGARTAQELDRWTRAYGSCDG